MERLRNAWMAAAVLLAVGCGNPSPPSQVGEAPPPAVASFQGPPADSVLFSFVFVGCNRINNGDVHSPFTNASTANVPQLQRTFQEVASLNPKPAFFFFLGDLVLGLEEDSTVLGAELAAWVAQYQDTAFSPLATSGIRLVAIPGNHEMLYMQKSDPAPGSKHKKSKGTEVPWAGAIGTWTRHMSAFMPEGPLHRVPGPDSLLQLQTYAFDFQNTHFIVLNTDTYNEQGEFGKFPLDWVLADLQAARQNSATQHIFLLSHKPAYVEPDGAADDLMDTTLRDSLWPVMNAQRAEALLSAHSHQYYRTQPNGQGSHQVVAGNGGSSYVKNLAAADQFMGWSIVYVMKNGEIQLRSWGRNVAASNYLDSIPAGVATTLRDSADLTWED